MEMKKDIDWLKIEIKKMFQDVVSGEIGLNAEMSLFKVYGLVKELDEPETISEEWIENHTASADTISYYSDESVPVVKVIKLKNLLVPKQDKPVIPKFVADYIERWKHKGLTIYEWFTFCNNDMDKDIEKWLYNNTDEENRKREYLLIDAIRNGYEVKKEKLYHVVNEENYFMLRKDDGLVVTVVTMQASPAMSRDKYGKDTRFMLTEKEIKDYDERYWAFAEEVVE